jgi:DNA-binding transcriptional ArsR family regulator
MAQLLQAIGEPRRQQILRIIWDREVAAGDIHRAVGGVTFGAVSQHLKILTEAGAVGVRRKGRQRYYHARKDVLGPLGAWLEQMWAEALSDLQGLAEQEEQ